MIKKLFLLLLSFVTFGALTASPVFAGTDLTVSCAAIGSCSISPGSTPLYNEAGWMPGDSVTQRLRITNSSAQNGFSAVQVQNYLETKNVGQVISIQIHQGSPVGPVIYSANSLQTFRNDGYFTLASLPAGQTQDYYFVSTMYFTAGNEYQGSQVQFDLRTGLELIANPPPSGGGGGNNGGGGGSSGGSQPPTCNANPPSSAPVVSITNVGTNTVTLSWSPVSPVTHYALIFTRISDGAQYGAPNIGNVTSYTINQLSGGANYRFQVFGVNDCAPGPVSNTSASRQIPGPVLTGRPVGGNGQVLGVETEATATPSATPAVAAATTGEVLGEQTCIDWYRYVPWILLIIQFFFILFWEWRLKDDDRPTKHIIALLTTIVSIVLFYLLRHCDCYGEWSWLAWLCKWYWIVSIILTLLIKGFSYAFLDESSDREKPPTAKPVSKTTALPEVEKPDAVATPVIETKTEKTVEKPEASEAKE